MMFWTARCGCTFDCRLIALTLANSPRSFSCSYLKSIFSAFSYRKWSLIIKLDLGVRESGIGLMLGVKEHALLIVSGIEQNCILPQVGSLGFDCAFGPKNEVESDSLVTLESIFCFRIPN